MATAGWALSPQQKYEMLSNLYIGLWKQLDTLFGESKWLDVQQVDTQALKASVDSAVEQLVLKLDDIAISEVVKKDYQRTQQIVAGIADDHARDFKEYLRDQGIRYAQAAADQRRKV
jgi:hypothetical protein